MTPTRSREVSNEYELCFVYLPPRAELLLQFFEKANAPSSPRKKPKLSLEHPYDEDEEQDGPRLSQDGFEDAMPGFYENEEAERPLDADDPEDSAPREQRGASRPPKSAPSSSAARNPGSVAGPSSSRATSHPPNLASGSAKRKRPRSPDPGEDHVTGTDEVRDQTCPICSKVLETDNRGLNEHIDFCLSKGAIREAQVMSNNVKSLKQPLPVKGKPGFKMKKAKKR